MGTPLQDLRIFLQRRDSAVNFIMKWILLFALVGLAMARPKLDDNRKPEICDKKDKVEALKELGDKKEKVEALKELGDKKDKVEAFQELGDKKDKEDDKREVGDKKD